MRIRLTLDITRTTTPTPAPDVETAPDVDTKAATDLTRRPSPDFDHPHRIGFMRTQETP